MGPSDANADTILCMRYVIGCGMIILTSQFKAEDSALTVTWSKWTIPHQNRDFYPEL